MASSVDATNPFQRWRPPGKAAISNEKSRWVARVYVACTTEHVHIQYIHVLDLATRGKRSD